MPVRTSRDSAVHGRCNEFEEPLQSGIEVMEIQRYTIQVEIVGGRLCPAPSLLRTVKHLRHLIKLFADTLGNSE